MLPKCLRKRLLDVNGLYAGQIRDEKNTKKRDPNLQFVLLQVNFYLLEKKAVGCEWIVWRTDTRYKKKNMTKIFNLYYSRWFFICKHSSHRDIKTHEHNVHFLWINIYSANEMYTKSTQGSFNLPNDTMIRQFGDCSNWSLLTAIVFQTETIHPWWKEENQTWPSLLNILREVKGMPCD